MEYDLVILTIKYYSRKVRSNSKCRIDIVKIT